MTQKNQKQEVFRKGRIKILRKRTKNLLIPRTGEIPVLVQNLKILVENMHKYDDLNDRPLFTLISFMKEFVEFRRKHAYDIGLLKDHTKNDLMDELYLLLKEGPLRYNIQFDPKIANNLGFEFGISIITDRTTLSLPTLIKKVNAIKDTQVLENAGYKYPENTADEMTTQIKSLRETINRIREGMLAITSDLEKFCFTKREKNRNATRYAIKEQLTFA